MAGIPTNNILQPSAISQSVQNRQLMVEQQILSPQYYKKYTERFGEQKWNIWLSTFAGMEAVKNQNFFWFESRGKKMVAITTASQINTPAPSATITVTLSSVDYLNSGTEAPLRVGESVYIASNNVEGKILSFDPTTPSAWTFTVRPKKLGVAFASPSGNLDAGEILIFGGGTDAGESSSSLAPIIAIDKQYNNNVTEFHESWSNTDLAQMADTYYAFPVSPELAGMGYSPFTYKGMKYTLDRFNNQIEWKLLRGDVQTNTGLGTSVGTQGLYIQAKNNGAYTLGYSGNNIDISKLHELTDIMEVNGLDKQVVWMCDLQQSHAIDDGIFKEFPAGAFVWGQGEKSQEASVAYGFASMLLDNGYLLQKKVKSDLNTEVTTGKTPANDYFRNFGFLYGQGQTSDSRTGTSYSNATVMYQEPPAITNGTIGNGLRLWKWGGGSENATDGTMNNKMEIVTYKGIRLCAANKTVFLQAS